MTRTKLCDRKLPDYTKGEELFHTISHGAGIGVGIVALIVCVVISAKKQDVFGIISGVVYGSSLILLYTMSSVYHGLRKGIAKLVMQILDHCTIYFLIAGTYTPVMLCGIRPISPAWGWSIFGVVWGCALVATIFTAIDLKKYEKFSMACYIGMGWCVVLAIKPTLEAIPFVGVLWLVLGGVLYTVGAILYGLGKKRRYMHSIFHVFVVAGSICHLISIIFYVL